MGTLHKARRKIWSTYSVALDDNRAIRIINGHLAQVLYVYDFLSSHCFILIIWSSQGLFSK